MNQIQFYEAKLNFEVDAWDLNEMLKKDENVVILDARSSSAHEKEHIPGALSFPHRVMSKETTRQLSKEALHVTYCDGIGCNASTKGALKMSTLGFKVKELIGGLDWWKRDGYTTHSQKQSGEKLSSTKKMECGC